ncbi:hypothetical protein PRVXH_001828 [Proteinivorax hydrogeniformans]|uniref:Lipoprotein n=1 Tax=Proteinivorax hydrogeniformans TaxID=1826727 RepID=A0AAU8HQY0_9FIRM
MKRMGIFGLVVVLSFAFTACGIDGLTATEVLEKISESQYQIESGRFSMEMGTYVDGEVAGFNPDIEMEIQGKFDGDIAYTELKMEMFGTPTFMEGYQVGNIAYFKSFDLFNLNEEEKFLKFDVEDEIGKDFYEMLQASEVDEMQEDLVNLAQVTTNRNSSAEQEVNVQINDQQQLATKLTVELGLDEIMTLIEQEGDLLYVTGLEEEMLELIIDDSFDFSLTTYVNNEYQIIKQKVQIDYELKMAGEVVKVKNTIDTEYWDINEDIDINLPEFDETNTIDIEEAGL